MIIKGYIESTLTELNKQYDKHSSIKKDIYYSKLAVMELCGWIEESFDAIIHDAINKELKTTVFKKLLKKTIDNNYGFKYDGNIRPMFITSFGLIAIEKFEHKLNNDGAKIDRLRSYLSNLVIIRNKNAHTFLRGTTATIQSPSLTIQDFSNIYPILKIIEGEFKLP